MMTSKNAPLALLLLGQLLAAFFSPAPWRVLWLVLAAATALALARGLRGRPCSRCGRRARVRYLVSYCPGLSPERCCAGCLSDAEWDALCGR